MSKKLPIIYSIIFLLVILFVVQYFLISKKLCPISENNENQQEEILTTTKGMMILIEYTDMIGLSNFVNEMYLRDITGVFYTGPDFVEENCEDIKEILKYKNIEIMGAYTKEPLWGMSYEDQYEALKDTKERIEDCTQQPIKILSSKYQASDENTVKVAEELGVPYIVARGTTETEAFVYQPEEYNVKILSVSNIPSIRFKYGSLCDYSYWVRGGSPEDMMNEFNQSIGNSKITPLSHTKIGGIKERWLNMWKEYWDTHDVEWVSLDEIMSTDMILPYWQIPQNINNPYTPKTMQPDFDLSEEVNIENPCAVDDLAFITETINNNELNTITVFHNNTGPMCLEMIEFFEQNNFSYESHINNENNFSSLLAEYKKNIPYSEGVSTRYEYYPIIFYNDRSFSGFNDEIASEILNLYTNN